MDIKKSYSKIIHAACIIVLICFANARSAEIFERLGKNPSLKAKLEFARGLYNDSKYDLALDAYRQIARDHPSEPMGYFGVASVYYVNENYSRAVINYKAAIKYEPKFFQAYEWLGNAYLNSGSREEALKAWNEALKINPASAAVSEKINTYSLREGKTGSNKIGKTVKLALKIYDEGYPEKALTQLLNLEKRYPGESVIKFWISRMHIWAGQMDKALLYSKRVSRLRGMDVSLIKYIGREEIPDYLYEIDALLGLYPSDPELQFYAGNVFRVNTDEYDRAVGLYGRAVDNGLKQKSKAYLAAAGIHKERGDLDEAVEGYRKAVNANNNEIEAHYQLGIIYLFDYGMPEKAGYHLNQVYRMNPNYRDIGTVIKERDKWL